MNVADPRALREVLRRHGVRAATSLGQRFLVDRAVLSAIVDAAELSPDDDVLEVGPGPGVLTAALAARVRSVTAVEVDPRMVALLEETLAEHENVRIVQADALKVDLLGIAGRPITRIVANLPYVSMQDRHLLAREVLHDPEVALFAGEKGDELIRKLIEQAPAHLSSNGVLALEIGLNQSEGLAEFLRQKNYHDIELKKDYAGIARFLVARYG